jgi:hypothetical protein
LPVAENDRCDDPGETSAIVHADVLGVFGVAPAGSRGDADFAIEGWWSGGWPLLVVTRGAGAGSRFLLDRSVMSVGRHLRSDICLDDVTVSSRHAEFRWNNDELRVVDMGGLNGIYVNREPVDWSLLVSGDEIQVGRVRLVVGWCATTRAGRARTS